MNRIIKTLLLFFQTNPYETALVVVLLIVSGLLEAIGVSMFLPFLQLFLEGQETISFPSAKINGLLIENNISLTYEFVGSCIVLAMTLKAVTLWTMTKTVSKVVSENAMNFRNSFLNAIVNSKWKYLTSNSTGETMNALAVEPIRASATFMATTRFAGFAIQVLVYICASLFVSWQLTLIIIFVGGLIALALKPFITLARSAGMSQTDESKSLLRHMNELMQNIKSLKAMALEDKFSDIVLHSSRQLQKSFLFQIFSNQALRIVYEPIMAISVIVSLYVAIKYGSFESSVLVVMIIFFIRALAAVNSMQTEYQRMVSQDSALWSLMKQTRNAELASEYKKGSQRGKPAPRNIQNITFKGISFSHKSKNILNKINCEFPAKKMIGIIGETGSGKTTILDMISGFYKPDEGTILIGEEDLLSLDLFAWRKKIGFVSQETYLFNSTLKDNIIMGRKGFSEADVRVALKTINSLDFVNKLPDGMNTNCGENGRALSGGQKQRVAIARAILHHPQILLLDEPTSALDPDTETRLFEILKKLSKKMTVIIVSHSHNIKTYTDTTYHVSQGKVKSVK